MTSRARVWTWIAGSLAVLVIAAVGLGWWVVYTQEGARWGFKRFGGLLPGKIEVADMKGPLRGPLEVSEFTYRDERLEIKVERVYVEWGLRELLRRRWDIRKLRAENVRVLVGAPGETEAARDSLEGPLPDLDLPVTIILRDAIVKNMTLTTPARPDTGFVIDRIELDARSMRRDSLHVNRLALRSKLVDFDFRGVAFPRGAYPVRLSGNWAFRPEGRPPIAGEGTLRGTLDTLLVDQNLSGPLTAHVDMRLVRPLRELRFDGGVDFEGVSLRDFDPEWPAGTFGGRVTLRGSMDSLTSAGYVRGTTEWLGPTAAEFRVARARSLWTIRDLVLRQPGNPGRLVTRGTVTVDTVTTRFNLETTWTDLDWPFQGEPWIQSDQGEARVEGTLQAMEVRARASLAGRDVPPGTWTLDGHGNARRLMVRTVIADILEGRIVGTGEVGWDPRPRWNLRFDGNGINPGEAWPRYHGKLSFAGRSEGTMTHAGPSGTVLVTRLDGTLRGQPIDAKGTVTARTGQYTLSGASAQWGPNRAEASGGFGRRWSLDWKLDAPRLSAAFPEASGALRGHGRIAGARATPRITGTLAGDSLFWGRAHADSLRAEGDVNLAAGGTVRLNVSAGRLTTGSRTAERFTLAATGTREAHEVRTSLAGRADSTVAVLSGGFGRGGWQGLLRTFDLVDPRAGNWSLASPARFRAGGGRLELADFVWQSGASRVTLKAFWDRDHSWRVDSRLDQVQLALFEPMLPPRLRLQGPLQGHLVARSTPEGRLYADVDLVPGPGEILHLTGMGQWVPTRFENARILATADGGRLRSSFGADLVGTGTVRGALALAPPGAEGAARRPLDGRIEIHLANLAMLQGFTTELDSTSGALDVDLVIAGTAARPLLYGPLTVRNGGAYVPRLGLVLREVEVRGSSSPGGRLAMEGSLRSGPGRLTFDGTAALAEGGKPAARLTLRGQRLQAMNTRDVSFLASPDLNATLEGKKVEVTGEVVIPEGTFDIGRQDERGLVRVSPDVVYAGSDTLTGAPFEFWARVRMVLGREVRVRGFGLEVQPTGAIVAVDEPGLPTLGTGQLDIREGTYTIYGQELEVERGSLVFGGGPINNPAIRARAQRTAPDGVIAGFEVRGTVMRPDVRIFSQPPMGQSEALSYILWGKPIQRGSLSEGQLASTLATTLGVPGTNLLAHGIASEVGIEQARIEVGESFQTAGVRVGTHLSPKLFVSYGMDVFEAESSLRLRYVLNRVFTIEAETASQNRVDLLYTLEP